MRTRWFGDLADGERLDASLLRLVGGVARLLDRLVPPVIAPGEARVDAAGSAVVLPRRGMSGCRLVVQVAEWSSSVGCWWSLGPDPLAGPAAGELAAEFPLHPDGLGRAVAWLEQELRRPVVERVRGYGVARRRTWAVVMDDHYELPVRSRWEPGWGPAGSPPPATGAPPAAGGPRRWAAPWLLGAAGAAAVLHWALSVAWLELDGAAWVNAVSTVLEVGALLALLAWFWVAGRAGPARVRAPMLAGLLLATLARGLGRLLQPAGPPAAADATREALGLLLRDWLPSLLGVAALACYLVAFCGLPGRGTLRPVWPVAAGLVWGTDLAVGLGALAASRPVEGDAAAPAWSGGLLVATRAVAVGLALALLLALLDRRPAMTRAAASAALAGAALLVVGWSISSQLLLSWLTGVVVLLAPPALGFALFSVPVGLGLFAGTALLALAAAEPPPSSPAPVQPPPGRSPSRRAEGARRVS